MRSFTSFLCFCLNGSLKTVGFRGTTLGVCAQGVFSRVMTRWLCSIGDVLFRISFCRKTPDQMPGVSTLLTCWRSRPSDLLQAKAFFDFADLSVYIDLDLKNRSLYDIYFFNSSECFTIWVSIDLVEVLLFSLLASILLKLF